MRKDTFILVQKGEQMSMQKKALWLEKKNEMTERRVDKV